VTREGPPLVAVLSKRGRFTVAEPVFERGRRITLDGGRRPGAGVGDLVLLGWGKRGPRVVRPLGRPDVARDVLEGLMLDRGLHRAFPRAVEAEAADVAADPPVDVARRDLTDLATFTIDPVTARDYDDAISARREDGGRIRIWVHIADVGAFVRPGGAIEREAFRRATSVYVPGAVEPMLPHALSSDACSLVPGADRLAVSVEMVLGGAAVESVAFHRSVIRSDARLTYEQVDRVYAGDEPASDPWGEPLALARAAAGALRERRSSGGSLEVSSDEPVFEFSSDGHVVAVRREEQTESHSTIEQLMVLANEQVAGWLEDHRKPTLYRVHEKPDPAAVKFLVERLESLGVATPPLPDHLSPQQAADAIGEISRLVAQHVRRAGHGRDALTSLVLRSLKQAYYSPRNVGHAGLASARYTHFTSPIRRYPDLIDHRLLKSRLAGQGKPAGGFRPPSEAPVPDRATLQKMAADSSFSERTAMEVEREVIDLYRAFFLRDRIGDVFQGTISGVMGFGLFVVIDEPFVEGLVRLEALSDDYYMFDEQAGKLVGRRSGRTFALGDSVEVVVQSVSVVRRKIDFGLNEHRAQSEARDRAGGGRFGARADGQRRDRGEATGKRDRSTRESRAAERAKRRRGRDDGAPAPEGTARIKVDRKIKKSGKTGLRTSAKRADKPTLRVHGSKTRPSSPSRGKRRK
jgi:ribonuclease R